MSVINEIKRYNGSSWVGDSIGALASNVTLSSTIYGSTNLNTSLINILPTYYDNDFLVQSFNGQMDTDNINNITVTEIDSALSNYNTSRGSIVNRISQIESYINDFTYTGNASTKNITNNSLVDLFHPVGSVYMSTNSTSPEVLFGGKWEQIQDSFLKGVSQNTLSESLNGTFDETYTITQGYIWSSYIKTYANAPKAHGAPMSDGIIYLSNSEHPAPSSQSYILNHKPIEGSNITALYVHKTVENTQALQQETIIIPTTNSTNTVNLNYGSITYNANTNSITLEKTIDSYMALINIQYQTKTSGQNMRWIHQENLPHQEGTFNVRQVRTASLIHSSSNYSDTYRSVRFTHTTPGTSGATSINTTSAGNYSRGLVIDFGGGQPTDFTPPYYTVYMWKRILPIATFYTEGIDTGDNIPLQTWNCNIGDTWEDFVNSNFNDSIFSISGNFVIYSSQYASSRSVLLDNQTPVQPTDQIINNTTYLISVGCCFASDTQIMTDIIGTTKPIQNIDIGDTVVIQNVNTGERKTTTALKVANEHYPTYQLATVEFTNGLVLQYNPYHPIWTTNGYKTLGYYKNYETLQVGDTVLLNNNIQITVKSIDIKDIQNGDYTTYNILLAGVNDYYLEDEWGYFANNILVHHGVINYFDENVYRLRHKEDCINKNLYKDFDFNNSSDEEVIQFVVNLYKENETAYKEYMKYYLTAQQYLRFVELYPQIKSLLDKD